MEGFNLGLILISLFLISLVLFLLIIANKFKVTFFGFLEDMGYRQVVVRIGKQKMLCGWMTRVDIRNVQSREAGTVSLLVLSKDGIKTASFMILHISDDLIFGDYKVFRKKYPLEYKSLQKWKQRSNTYN